DGARLFAGCPGSAFATRGGLTGGRTAGLISNTLFEQGHVVFGQFLARGLLRGDFEVGILLVRLFERPFLSGVQNLHLIRFDTCWAGRYWAAADGAVATVG